MEVVGVGGVLLIYIFSSKESGSREGGGHNRERRLIKALL